MLGSGIQIKASQTDGYLTFNTSNEEMPITSTGNLEELHYNNPCRLETYS